MYDDSLTRQSLPSERYRLLLGTALSVFSSNNGFVIENILNTDLTYSWYELIDKESGRLIPIIATTITKKAGDEIAILFSEIIEMRNRIIHGFRITSSNGEQVIATKCKKSGVQFEITEEYLMTFIKLNEELSDRLHAYRGY
ncbi:hypothetical protein HO542_01235 [Streptococcus suis]|uniref:hypothetical protein n=1 Tax=Streptococcus parasuis TaxID=1501662 RepID=UPI0015553E19|nr:hypothetical protein [Streptococcus parasuis]NQJ69991.1 hypothetical protein [Streptococcus suis]MDG4477359.1 hypothetical protein [Streptococcus parasuis]NQK49148.1 hypothetical protein [Streptococcus suis]NQM02711.1 hypothetical protein [Streptococcus suis]HEM4136773.1 hypothetical protein [Streptococcus suis]